MVADPTPELGGLSMIVEAAVTDLQHDKIWDQKFGSKDLSGIIKSLIQKNVAKAPIPIDVSIAKAAIINEKGILQGTVNATGTGAAVDINLVLANSLRFSNAITTERLDINRNVVAALASNFGAVNLDKIETDVRAQMASPNTALFNRLKLLLAERKVDLAGLLLRFEAGSTPENGLLRVRLRPSTVPPDNAK